MTMLYPIVLETEESGAVSAYVPGLPVYAAADTHALAERAIRAVLPNGVQPRRAPREAMAASVVDLAAPGPPPDDATRLRADSTRGADAQPGAAVNEVSSRYPRGCRSSSWVVRQLEAGQWELAGRLDHDLLMRRGRKRTSAT